MTTLNVDFQNHIFGGTIIKDVEVRTPPNSESSIATFTVRCGTGDKAEFFNCVKFGLKTPAAVQFFEGLKKGTKVIVTQSETKTRKDESKQPTRYFTDYVVKEMNVAQYVTDKPVSKQASQEQNHNISDESSTPAPAASAHRSAPAASPEPAPEFDEAHAFGHMN